MTIISCVISVTNNNIYQDSEWANAQWLGQDIVTLFLSLPILILSYIKGIKRRHLRWQMVYAGTLFYYIYTYSFFMFAANLTVLYLFHLPIYGLSIVGFFISCIGLFSNKNVSLSFNRKWLKLGIVIYLIMISLMVSFLWLNDIFAHLTNPEHISDTPDGEAPLMITSAISIYKNKNWELILNGIILTKTSALGFALMSMAFSMYLQDLSPNYFLIFLWSIIGIVGTIFTTMYLRRIELEL